MRPAFWRGGRERREIERERESVCVCVREREREKKRETREKKKRKRPTDIQTDRQTKLEYYIRLAFLRGSAAPRPSRTLVSSVETRESSKQHLT